MTVFSLCLHFLKGGSRKEHHVVFKKKKDP
jgi:hypothetical protein